MISKVAIVGAGNVAWHLAHALKDAGCTIEYVCSRTTDRAEELAQSVNSRAVNDLSHISKADLVLVAISDDDTADVCDAIDAQFLVAHTSGMTHLDNISRERKAAFYPLQTFSRDKEVLMTEVPFCLEASDEGDLEDLRQLAQKISDSVQDVSSDQRQRLHLAAVFASNFVNHMYHLSEVIANNDNLDFDLLRPLIREVAGKINSLPPAQAQTGPARRKDMAAVKKHLEMLEGHPELRELYQVITNSIIKHHHGE